MSILFDQDEGNNKSEGSCFDESILAKARRLIENISPDKIGGLLWDNSFPTKIIAYIMKLDSIKDFREAIGQAITVDEIVNTTTINRLKVLERMGYIRKHGRIKNELYGQGRFEDVKE